MNASTRTVVGVFHDRQQAQRAVEDLKRSGFTDADIGVISRDGERDSAHTGTTASHTSEKGSHAAAGAATGAAAGAGVGALWALGIAAGILPAIGPVIAGGLLASVLASAAGGAAVAGIVGALIGLGVPEDEARYYESEVKGGRTLVTVKADGRYDQAVAIIRRHGGYDKNNRPAAETTSAAAQTVSPSMPPSSPQHVGGATTAGYAAPQHSTSAQSAGTNRMELHEEQLNVHKQSVPAGEVTVRKEVITEHKTIDVPVQREEVVIERHPVSGTARGSEIGQGQEIRVPVSKEEVQVEKQAVVKEEVTVGKQRVQETEHVGGDVRREEVKVEREGNVDVHDNTGKDAKNAGGKGRGKR